MQNSKILSSTLAHATLRGVMMRFLMIFIGTLAMTLSAPLAYAQGDAGRSGLAGKETTVWMIQAPSLDESISLQMRIGLEEALSGEQGRHVIGQEAFEAHVKARNPPAPSCLYGVGDCVSAESMTFDALDLALVVRVKIRKSGGRYEAAYRLIDRRGSASGSDQVVNSTSPRDLAFTLVREIYNATGTVNFVTTPPGATIRVDGSAIGITPMEYRLPIGRHQFSVKLERYKSLESSMEVTSKEITRVEVGLELQPAILIIDNPPPGALLYVEGGPQGVNAEQPVELPPGEYSYEVRAEGFRPRKEVVQLEPGMALHRDAAMESSKLFTGELSEDAILNNRYVMRLFTDISFQNTSFRGARAAQSGELGDLAFERFAPEMGETDLDPRRFFSPRGLRLDFSYMWKNFGLGLLSIAYLTDANEEHRYAAIVEDLETGMEKRADVVRVSRFQVRPFQIQYRRLIDNIAPFAELGLGINFQWVTLVDEGQDDALAYSLRQSEAFWNLELGAQYFFTSNWFVVGRYSFHDHFNLGVGSAHTLSFGVGGAFSNLFGFEPEPPSKL